VCQGLSHIQCIYIAEVITRGGVKFSKEEDIPGISDELQRLCVSMVTDGITSEAFEVIMSEKLAIGPGGNQTRQYHPVCSGENQINSSFSFFPNTDAAFINVSSVTE